MIKKILVAPLGVFYVGTAERKRSGFGMVEPEKRCLMKRGLIISLRN